MGLSAEECRARKAVILCLFGWDQAPEDSRRTRSRGGAGPEGAAKSEKNAKGRGQPAGSRGSEIRSRGSSREAAKPRRGKEVGPCAERGGDVLIALRKAREGRRVRWHPRWWGVAQNARTLDMSAVRSAFLRVFASSREIKPWKQAAHAMGQEPEVAARSEKKAKEAGSPWVRLGANSGSGEAHAKPRSREGGKRLARVSSGVAMSSNSNSNASPHGCQAWDPIRVRSVRVRVPPCGLSTSRSGFWELATGNRPPGLILCAVSCGWGGGFLTWRPCN